MSALGLAELADRTLLEVGGWSVLLVDEPHIDAATAALEEEVAFLLGEDGSGRALVFAARDSGAALLEDLARLESDDVALLPLRPSTLGPLARALDYGRDRLVGRSRGVIITSEEGVRALAAAAPSFWSWIGPRVWKLDPAAGQIDPEARLSSLREGTGLTDAEVLERAEAGTLALDPVFAEWLILLGRGDLLGH